jgi:NAD(P)-dependent dehydrogenase (short-subunit alcohol dehydrogenase family)
MGRFAMTGGATGIGAAVKDELRRQGHEVFVVDIGEADITADLSTTQGRRAAIDGITAWASDGLDGFVPCAGVGPSTSPPSLVTRINYFGTVELVQALAPLVGQRRGCMVLISSNSAPMGSDASYVEACLSGDEEKAARLADEIGDGQNAYAGSKLAVTRWMRRHAAGYARDGVRMNAVAPGITKTPLQTGSWPMRNSGLRSRPSENRFQPAGSGGPPNWQASSPSCWARARASCVARSSSSTGGTTPCSDPTTSERPPAPIRSPRRPFEAAGNRPRDPHHLWRSVRPVLTSALGGQRRKPPKRRRKGTRCFPSVTTKKPVGYPA